MQAAYLETLLQNACPCIYFKYTLEDTVYYSQQCPLYEEAQGKSYPGIRSKKKMPTTGPGHMLLFKPQGVFLSGGFRKLEHRVRPNSGCLSV